MPQFGEWEQKGQGQLPDYSLDFSKIREMRRQNKREVSRASLGNEEEFIHPNATTATTAPTTDDHHHYPPTHHSPTVSIHLIFKLIDQIKNVEVVDFSCYKSS